MKAAKPNRRKKKHSFSKKLYRITVILMLVVGVAYFLKQDFKIRDTVDAFRNASVGWLIVAMVSTFFTYCVAAVTQKAAGNFVGSFSTHLQIQLSGFFISHFTPFSVGVIGLIDKYYSKRGKSNTESLAIATAPTVFGFITTMFLVLIIAPTTFLVAVKHYAGNTLILILSIIIITVLILILLMMRFAKKTFKKYLKYLIDVKGAILSKRQLIWLIVGSLLITFFSAFTLYVSLRASHIEEGLLAVFLLYITSSVVTAITPTPGGIGATEAALIVGLTGLGNTSAVAIPAIFFYRFINYWLPVIPGAITLRQFTKSENLKL